MPARGGARHSTLTNWRFFGPFLSNFTLPSFFANSV
jgi:hypothetical protein